MQRYQGKCGRSRIVSRLSCGVYVYKSLSDVFCIAAIHLCKCILYPSVKKKVPCISSWRIRIHCVIKDFHIMLEGKAFCSLLSMAKVEQFAT